MKLFDYIFPKRKQQTAIKQYFTGFRGYSPVYTTFAGGVYEMELTRACISAFATHCSKLAPEVIEKYDTGLANILRYQPNAFMSTSKFLYRIATIWAINNTAFIFPLYDDYGNICGYYPALPTQAFLHQEGDQLYVD